MDIAARFREGRRRGLDDRTVGNLVAYSMGVPPVARGWTRAELAHLDFVRWLDERQPDVVAEVDRIDGWP